LQCSVGSDFLRFEYCDCASAQEFRSVRSVIRSESIKSRDKIVVQLHQHVASSHEPNRFTFARVAAIFATQFDG
jgi:hypothetical protein